MTLATTSETDSATASAWRRFWFVSDPDERPIQVVRLGLSIVACWYFVSHWSDIGFWFSATGVLATSQVGSFLDAADLSEVVKWRWSPLYLVDSTVVLRMYLVIGVVLAVAAAFVRRTRVFAVLLWLWVVWLANRSILIAGPEELVLSAGLAYSAIAGPTAAKPNWLHVFARRLMQVHTTLLIGITGLTMLSAEIWWDGTGSAAVNAPVGRRLFDLTSLLEQPLVHEPLTHVIVLIALAAPFAIWWRQTRFATYVAIIIWCFVLALLSSQWLYFTTLAILTQSFGYPPRPPSEIVRSLTP